jgi:predicted membrane protein
LAEQWRVGAPVSYGHISSLFYILFSRKQSHYIVIVMMSVYQFDHKFRGTALIIGNEFKGQCSGERKGCLRDVQMAEELFKRLDFNVTAFMNLSAVDMKKKMEIGCNTIIILSVFT